MKNSIQIDASVTVTKKPLMKMRMGFTANRQSGIEMSISEVKIFGIHRFSLYGLRVFAGFSGDGLATKGASTQRR
jgi:hypothetical protein